MGSDITSVEVSGCTEWEV